MQAAESRSQAGRGPKIQSEGCHRLNLCVLTTETPGTWYTTLKDISVDKWPQRSRAPSPQCLGTPRTQQQSGGRGNCHSLSFHYLNECSHNMMIKFRVSVSSCFRNKDHKCNGLKQHTFIMYFMVLWVMSLTWLLTGQNPRALWGCLPSGDARGSSVSLSFSTSADFPWSLTWGPLPPSSKPAMAGQVLLTLNDSGLP